jgi:hypothetical protein
LNPQWRCRSRNCRFKSVFDACNQTSLDLGSKKTTGLPATGCWIAVYVEEGFCRRLSELNKLAQDGVTPDQKVSKFWMARCQLNSIRPFNHDRNISDLQ